MFGCHGSVSFDQAGTSPGGTHTFDQGGASLGDTRTSDFAPSPKAKSVGPAVDPTAEIARCFLRLANLPNYTLDRLSRYEVTLWRQVDQMLLTLDSLNRRKPQERRRRFSFGRPF
jgi:hypothetical protein